MSGWCPSHWLEDVHPPFAPAPDAFIYRIGRQSWQLRHPGAAVEHDAEPLKQDLAIGDVVAFTRFVSLGMFKLTVREDRTFSTDRPITEPASHFWTLSQDIDIVADSPAALLDHPLEPLPPGRHDMGACHWSAPIRLQFDGNRFMQIDGSSRRAPGGLRAQRRGVAELLRALTGPMMR